MWQVNEDPKLTLIMANRSWAFSRMHRELACKHNDWMVWHTSCRYLRDEERRNVKNYLQLSQRLPICRNFFLFWNRVNGNLVNNIS